MADCPDWPEYVGIEEMRQRFLNKTFRTSECWLWLGGQNGVGYGKMGWGPRTAQRFEDAHRIAFRLFRGEIAEGLYVCHSCDNKRCVRPDHLFLGTCRDNMQDAKRKGRTRNGNAVKTHCIRGHAFAEHGYTNPNRGNRCCRICQLASARKYRERVARERSHRGF